MYLFDTERMSISRGRKKGRSSPPPPPPLSREPDMGLDPRTLGS